MTQRTDHLRREPVSPTIPEDAGFRRQATNEDQTANQVATSCFQKIKATGRSCCGSLPRKICKAVTKPINIYCTSVALAVYPIIKLVIATIAHIATGAAFALPPVAIGLLIAASTLFLMTVIISILKKEKVDIGIILQMTVPLVLAPITVTVVGISTIYEAVKKCCHSRPKAHIPYNTDRRQA